jgi:hypothetical protein
MSGSDSKQKPSKPRLLVSLCFLTAAGLYRHFMSKSQISESTPYQLTDSDSKSINVEPKFPAAPIYLLAGLLLVLSGVGLSIWVLIPPSLPVLQGAFNKASITCYVNGEERTEGINYLVDLVPDPKSEDVLVRVETDLEPSAATEYVIDWYGDIRPTPAPEGEFQLAVTAGRRMPNGHVRLSARNQKNAQVLSHDIFSFYWKRGKEKLSFTDYLMRISMAPSSGKLSLEVSLLGSQQILRESPVATRVEPQILYGREQHLYLNEHNVMISYTELDRKNLSQYIILLSGILIGLGSNLISQQVIEYVSKRW